MISLIKVQTPKPYLRTTNNLPSSTFPSFDLSMFIEEDGATMNDEDGKKF